MSELFLFFSEKRSNSLHITVSVENGVEQALKKHVNGKTQKELAANKVNVWNITDFFQSTPESSDHTQSSSDVKSSIFTSNMLDVKNKTVRVELKYALNVMKIHSSFNFCGNLGEFLRDIFSDSPTVSYFTLGQTKFLYLIKFGIAPWITQKLMNQVSTPPYLSVFIDDSHNSVLEMEQMDLQVRFWCLESNVSKTKYVRSQFNIVQLQMLYWKSF